MYIKLLPILIVIGTLLSASEEWKEIKIDKNISIRLPGKVSIRKQQSEQGLMTEYKAQLGLLTFTLICKPNAGLKITYPDQLETAYEGALKGILSGYKQKEMQYQIIEKSTLPYPNGFFAKRIKLNIDPANDVSHNQLIHYLYIINDNFYFAAASYNSQNLTDAEKMTLRFFAENIKITAASIQETSDKNAQEKNREAKEQAKKGETIAGVFGYTILLAIIAGFVIIIVTLVNRSTRKTANKK